ncbi:MAG: RidA family protein [Deltaproteobacteria bacterium]|nr:RidA family protein [Deltaproteobacteria bacterium]
MSVEAKLKSLGLELPSSPAPAANYVPFVREGNLLFISGQVTFNAQGKLVYLGKLGRDFTAQEGYQAARLCALNCLAQAKAALGSLDHIRRVVRVGGFVNSAEDFIQQPEVINGVSDLMVELFGDSGRHARAAIGCNTLPRGVAVEVDMILAVQD